MSASMAEVLAAHWTASTHTDKKPFVDKCDGCGEVILTWGGEGDAYGVDGSTRLAAHQADVLAANGYGKLEDAKAPEVRYATLTNGETELDEVVAFNAYVHLEVMADNHWWMKISAADTEVDVNLYTKRAKITAHEDTYRRPE